MKNMVFVLVLLGLVWGGQAQVTEKEKSHGEPSQETPKGAWKVHKEFDENGNLIRYDSVYSWSSDEATRPYDQEMLDSLFGEIPRILEPIGNDMAEFFDNDPFFSQIFGSKGEPSMYSQPFSMQEIEDLLRSDSLDIDDEDIDQMLEEMDRLRLEVIKQLRGQPKSPEKQPDSLQKY